MNLIINAIKYSGEEKKIITPAVSRVSEALEILITQGLQDAMNKYNKGKVDE